MWYKHDKERRSDSYTNASLAYFVIFDSAKPKAALTSRELAAELQELRKEMDSQNTDIRRLGNIQKSYEMITQMPS